MVIILLDRWPYAGFFVSVVSESSVWSAVVVDRNDLNSTEILDLRLMFGFPGVSLAPLPPLSAESLPAPVEDSVIKDLFFEFSSKLESLVTFFSAPLGLPSPDGAAGSGSDIILGCFSSVSFRVGPARGEGVMGVTGSSTRGSMSPLLALALELVAAAAAAAGELGFDLKGLLKSAANPLVLRLLPAGVLVSVASNPPAELFGVF